MKLFKIEGYRKERDPLCQWIYSDKTVCNGRLTDTSSSVNGKFFCTVHTEYFEHVNRQFKILEEIGEQENEND